MTEQEKHEDTKHSYAGMSFAHFCEQVSDIKRKQYFSESFIPEIRSQVFGESTECDGLCEGTGWVPVHREETSSPQRKQWVNAELCNKSSDGFHFLPCPKCSNGLEDKFIVREGNSFTMKDSKSGEVCEHVILESSEDSDEDDEDEDKDDEDTESLSPDEKKEKAKEKRAKQTKIRTNLELLPYEYPNQKSAKSKSVKLGLKGTTHIDGRVTKPGPSEDALRHAVALRKQKASLRGVHPS